MSLNRDRLARLLQLTDSDKWREDGVDAQATYVDEFLATDPTEKLRLRYELTLEVPIEEWASEHTCTTAAGAREHFAERLHPERMADALNQWDEVCMDGVGFNVTAMEQSRATAAAQPQAGAASVSRGVVYVDRVVRVAVDQEAWSDAEGLGDQHAGRDLARYVDHALTAAGDLVPLVEERDGTVTVMPGDDVQARDERGDWWTCSLHGGAVTQDCACSGVAGTGNLAVAAQALWEAGHPGGDWSRTDSATRRYVEQRVRLVIEAYHAAPAAG